jgi:ribonuclease T2
MNKLILLFIVFSVSLFAKYDAFPTQECPAFNNMKHTKNTHSVYLDTSKKYTVLKHHKGQNLILVKGEQPAQRWVDDTCFSKDTDTSNPLNVSGAESRVIAIGRELPKTDKDTDNIIDNQKYKDNYTNKYENGNISRQNLLTLSWHNAFCETHRYKKECKRSTFSFGRPNYSEKHFVLHGLWPQPKNRLYCGVDSHTVTMDKHKQWNRLPDLGLSNEVRIHLKKMMPGFASGLHKHEWIKHGTCYGTDANRYYEDSIRMVEQMNNSKVGDFFKKHIGKHVTLHQVRSAFDRSFGVGTGKRVALKCKKGLITELWLHLGSGSDDLGELLKQGQQTRSQCQGGFIDKAGF